FLTPMSEFQQAAIKETENFAKTPKEKSCQQIFNRGLSLSTASLTGCKCSKANVVVASNSSGYPFCQTILVGARPKPHETQKFLLRLRVPAERFSISAQMKSKPKIDAKSGLWRASFVCFSEMR